ncbi:MAG: hypothetical protein R3239_05430, partial [Thermodesulfobacteriota bacterium]|nr:hypothetical protein [Thermodesulfobacteriota bacterium]
MRSPPPGIASTAFVSRLKTTRSISDGSAMTVGAGMPTWTWERIPFIPFALSLARRATARSTGSCRLIFFGARFPGLAYSRNSVTTPFRRSASSTMMSRNSRSRSDASRDRNWAAPLITPAGVRTSWANPAASSPTVAKCSLFWILCFWRMFSTASPIPSRNGINNSCSRKDGVFSFHRNIATPTIFPRRKMGKEASQESSQMETSAAREPPCSRNRSMGNRAENRASARRYSSGRTGSEPTPSSVPPSGWIQRDARA